MPKLDRFSKKNTDPLEEVTEEKERNQILGAFRATECYVLKSRYFL
jgi:hypothetical protein